MAARAVRTCQACLGPMPKTAGHIGGYLLCSSCWPRVRSVEWISYIFSAVYEAAYIEGVTKRPTDAPPTTWPWKRSTRKRKRKKKRRRR